MCVSSLEEKLKVAKNNNKLPKIIIPVHMAGKSCDMKQIYRLSKKYRFKIIEDASRAMSADHNFKKVGSCEFSDATIFSFSPVKIITTGEGGMVLTNHLKLDQTLKLLRQNSITKRSEYFKKSHTSDWYYEQHLLGLIIE